MVSPVSVPPEFTPSKPSAIHGSPAFSHAYFLHILATDPKQVIPDGKSLLSLMSRSRETTGHDPNPLHDRVESFVHKMFWDEALKSLSSPLPSVTISRISRLYADLHSALKPLLPAASPELTLLSSPMSPTSSPLSSCRQHLREVLLVLRRRCAPIHDSELDQLIYNLDHTTELPTLIISTTKSILHLSEAMQDDLHNFSLGSMTEVQLYDIIRQDAKTEERKVIQDVWGPSDVIRKLWLEWLQEGDTMHASWTTRLLQSLAFPVAVSCSWPTLVADEAERNPNRIPPTFVFTTPALIYIQNFLQALVIAATLRSLTRLPPSDSSTLTTTGQDFMQRVWLLLRAEIDEEGLEENGTKLINLSDEVLRARRLSAQDVDAEEETRLRSAVERTLQTSDPVYILLQKRLIEAIDKTVLAATQSTTAPVAPEHMQTGRSTQINNLHRESDGDRRRSENVIVKGFEDPVLVKGISEVIEKFLDVVAWTKDVWKDVV